ncbi:hypothetical protein SAZ11_53710 [Streptomyces sp. FXJ1.4098]|nr:hypothetical protein [Streptomyces sp. FXJ1.4098]
MVTENATAARAVNAMTANWARETVHGRGTVLTAAGVWPALALLADGADGPARRELEEALGSARTPRSPRAGICSPRWASCRVSTRPSGCGPVRSCRCAPSG